VSKVIRIRVVHPLTLSFLDPVSVAVNTAEIQHIILSFRPGSETQGEHRDGFIQKTCRSFLRPRNTQEENTETGTADSFDGFVNRNIMIDDALIEDITRMVELSEMRRNTVVGDGDSDSDGNDDDGPGKQTKPRAMLLIMSKIKSSKFLTPKTKRDSYNREYVSIIIPVPVPVPPAEISGSASWQEQSKPTRTSFLEKRNLFRRRRVLSATRSSCCIWYLIKDIEVLIMMFRTLTFFFHFLEKIRAFVRAFVLLRDD